MIASGRIAAPPTDAVPAVTTSTSPAPISATPPGIVPAATYRANSSVNAVLTPATLPGATPKINDRLIPRDGGLSMSGPLTDRRSGGDVVAARFVSVDRRRV